MIDKLRRSMGSMDSYFPMHDSMDLENSIEEEENDLQSTSPSPMIVETDSEEVGSKQEITQQNSEELTEYDHCVNVMSKRGIKITRGDNTSKSIAFMVEAMKQLYREKWRDELSSFRDFINTEEKSLIEVSWFIHTTISTLYSLALEENENFASVQKDEMQAQRIHQVRTIAGAFEEAMNNLHKKNFKTPPPPIVDDLLPEWYINSLP